MPDISILVITYNRSAILLETIENLKRTIGRLPEVVEIVIADDCSDPEHRRVIDSIPDVRIVRTDRNSGLGANSNNGMRHCAGSLILQIQDDWRFDGDESKVVEACRFMQENPDVGIVQLSPVWIDLPVSYRDSANARFRIFPNDHVPWRRRCNVRPYSDNPHIKRREFVASVGPYLEGVPMTICEAEYQKRVANQSRWRVAMLEESLFFHVGEEASLNPGGQQHWLVKIFRSIPGGERFLEPAIRSSLQWVDHCAARVLSR